MLTDIGNFIILKQLGHLIFAKFRNFKFFYFLFFSILKNNYFLPTYLLTYGSQENKSYVEAPLVL